VNCQNIPFPEYEQIIHRILLSAGRGILFADVWGFVKVRSGQATAQVRDAVGQAFDYMAQTITEYVRIPAKAAAATEQTIAKGTVWGTRTIKDFLRKPFSKKADGDSR